jgi:NAD(P)-dependent dehydrogenase (short-subunit alcohol dehydrogenase family)
MSQIALVTGASSGIGKGCAQALLKEGWTVVLTGRREDALKQAIEELGADGARGIAIASDVGQEASVKALFEQIKARCGRLDLMFNNAGISPRATTPDQLSGDEWRQCVDVNLNGMFYCLSAAFGMMREQSPQGGRIINNGSISATAPRPGSIAYTATKHAVSGLTKTASLDGRPFDIAVGQIDIGNVASDMTAKMVAGVAMARLPLTANVLFTTVMATKMPYVGRG